MSLRARNKMLLEKAHVSDSSTKPKQVSLSEKTLQVPEQPKKPKKNALNCGENRDGE